MKTANVGQASACHAHNVGQASACQKKAPRGFTLVELLAVVMIIAMVLGLLTPALMGARRSALNAKVKAELDLLHMALMNYKNEYGSFPPAYCGPIPNTTPVVALNNAATYTRHPVYRHLVRIFPRINEAPAQYALLADMSPAQAMVFWLRGFYENPEYPLTNGGVAGQRKKFFDFEESRLYAASTYAAGGTQTFLPRQDVQIGDFRREYPVYFTGQPTSGLPYVYFDSRCYDAFPNDVYYTARALGGGEDSTAVPYLTSEPAAGSTWSQFHLNSDTFQIIASGLDGKYGPLLPQSAGYTALQAAFPNSVAATFKNGSVDVPVQRVSAGVTAGHLDNITNFASKTLAEAMSALKTD